MCSLIKVVFLCCLYSDIASSLRLTAGLRNHDLINLDINAYKNANNRSQDSSNKETENLNNQVAMEISTELGLFARQLELLEICDALLKNNAFHLKVVAMLRHIRQQVENIWFWIEGNMRAILKRQAYASYMAELSVRKISEYYSLTQRLFDDAYNLYGESYRGSFTVDNLVVDTVDQDLPYVGKCTANVTIGSICVDTGNIRKAGSIPLINEDLARSFLLRSVNEGSFSNNSTEEITQKESSLVKGNDDEPLFVKNKLEAARAFSVRNLDIDVTMWRRFSAVNHNSVERTRGISSGNVGYLTNDHNIEKSLVEKV